MRKITKNMINAFMTSKNHKEGNTTVNVNHFATCGTLTQIYLHGNLIAQHDNEGLKITNAGWQSNVTKERLNALPNVNIQQKNFQWYLNGKKWDGEWVNVAEFTEN